LLGTWEMTSMRISVGNQTGPWASGDDIAVLAYTLELERDTDGERTFRRVGAFTQSGTWSLDGQYLVLEFSAQDIQRHRAEFSNSNNTLTLTRTTPASEFIPVETTTDERLTRR